MTSLIRLAQLPANERRRSPRFLVNPATPLVVGVAVPSGAGKPRTFTGRARDVSESGVCVLLPRGEDCEGLGGRELIVVFSLPSGVVRLHGEVAYCDRLEDGEGGDGYAVGVRFTEAGSGGDHERLRGFLNSQPGTGRAADPQGGGS